MILKDDCLEVMKAMKPNSVDAIVTDPPYGLEFMGKEWDKLWDKREFGKTEYSKKSFTCSDGSTRKTNPVTRNLNNPNYKAGLEAQLWHTQWLTEAYRVLKPGGSMLVMGGTRTSHRLACAIEDSGFIIKDTLMWIYGSGFPKAQDLGKMIDKRAGKEREIIGKRLSEGGKTGFKTFKGGSMVSAGREIDVTIPSTDLAKHWDGFKVGGIKPAYEPIIWAVKPPEGSYVDNVLKWGVGAVNVDECRIGFDNDEQEMIDNRSGKGWGTNQCSFGGRDEGTFKSHSKGRFPANVILSHHLECVQVGTKRVKGEGRPKRFQGSKGGAFSKAYGNQEVTTDPDGLETVESWDCHPDCAVRMLDEQSGVLKSGNGNRGIHGSGDMFPIKPMTRNFNGDSGGASRFFYCAKASRGERNAGLEGMEEKSVARMGHGNNEQDEKTQSFIAKMKNVHPTVKPIKLFEYLIKLVTREGQIILDPFIGSGTTAIATHNTGRKCIGIEKEDEYLIIAKRRIDYWRNQPKQMEMGL